MVMIFQVYQLSVLRDRQILSEDGMVSVLIAMDHMKESYLQNLLLFLVDLSI